MQIVSTRELKRISAIHPTFLILLSLAGLFFGNYVGLQSWDQFPRVVGPDVKIYVSFIDLWAVNSVTLLASSVALCFGLYFMLYPICFYKCFLTGYNIQFILYWFRDGAWLARFLFLFSDTLILPVLVWLWFKHTNIVRNTLYRDVLFSCFWCVFVILFEYRYVLPFFTMVVNR